MSIDIEATTVNLKATMGILELLRNSRKRKKANKPGLPPSQRPQVQHQSNRVPDSRLPTTTMPTRGTAKWIPAGERIIIDGRTIDGGMIYVGSDALSADKSTIEPCLINLRLPVDWQHPDQRGETMSYWPSYNRIDRSARAAYLDWLIDGRQDPAAYIGYVFLFYYGLERRLLCDLRCDSDHPDVPTLLAEVDRLSSIYNSNRSFAGYSQSLLNFYDGLRSVYSDVQPIHWTPESNGKYMPISLRVGVGRYVANGLRLPAEWALSYLRHHPATNLRMPATRCSTEFDELFMMRYQKRFRDGMKIRRPSRNLTLSYHPASAGLRASVSATIETIPDVNSISGPINKLNDLAFECSDELDAYSRFLGRRPADAETAWALSLLPNDLILTHGGRIVDDLQVWTSQLLEDQASVVVALDDVVTRSFSGHVDKLTKRDAVSLASLLGKIGIGIEPDVRFGASTPKPGSNAVLFSLPEGAAANPSAACTTAMSLIHLTAMVAVADGTISPSEEKHLAEHAEHVLGLDAAECARLEAHLAFLATDKPSMVGIKRKVEALSTEERAAIGEFLIHVAAADGVVSPEEITTLTKLYMYLGLDEADVYRRVHALGIEDPGPVIVREAEPTTRWAIPEPDASPAQETVTLDLGKIEARLAETTRVAALLTDIFADDEDAYETLDELKSIDDSVHHLIDGLDPAHSAFAIALTEQQNWNRSDLEELAESLGLPMVEGALGIVNEAVIDICGEPLIEGEDPLEINTYAIEEI